MTAVGEDHLSLALFGRHFEPKHACVSLAASRLLTTSHSLAPIGLRTSSPGLSLRGQADTLGDLSHHVPQVEHRRGTRGAPKCLPEPCGFGRLTELGEVLSLLRSSAPLRLRPQFSNRHARARTITDQVSRDGIRRAVSIPLGTCGEFTLFQQAVLRPPLLTRQSPAQRAYLPCF